MARSLVGDKLNFMRGGKMDSVLYFDDSEDVKRIGIDKISFRLSLVYYQHGVDDYQNYTIETNGKIKIRDTHYGSPKLANIHVWEFLHQFRDGMLIVDVRCATKTTITYHIARPGEKVRERVIILEKNPPVCPIPQ